MQDINNILQQYKIRLAKEGWIKSILSGISTGACAMIICALICWIFGIKYLWIYILIFAAMTAITTVFYYFCNFKSSRSQLASRIDNLGLEERVLTMTQFKQDNSYIARRQREDTLNILQKFNKTSIKIIIPTLMIILCCVALIFGVGATVASLTSDSSLIGLIQERNEQKNILLNSFHLVYSVNDNSKGRVDGNLEQTIKNAENGTMVQAVAADGYVFIGWSDGYESATRIDEDVKKDISVNAIFVAIEDNEEQDETLEEQQEGNPSSGNSPASPNNQGDPTGGGGNGQGDGAGAGSDSASNQVIDGSTYYGDEYGSSLSDAQNEVGSNSNLSSGEKDVIGDYFHNIQK